LDCKHKTAFVYACLSLGAICVLKIKHQQVSAGSGRCTYHSWRMEILSRVHWLDPLCPASYAASLTRPIAANRSVAVVDAGVHADVVDNTVSIEAQAKMLLRYILD
jgi:hypothetical protein